MIEVSEALTRRQQKDFIEFPNRLYKGNPYFVPALYLDEVKIFRKDYLYYETCEAVYFNAYEDGKMVGRISGILQRAANEKNNQKRVRFTRFDCIDKFEVAEALFGAVEKWALEKGMDTIVGPLGFSDLDREGLLIEGFDQPNTFEEQYNAAYYQTFIERLGYVKEVDWYESRIYPADKEEREQMEKMSAFILKRYKLHFGKARNGKEFVSKYVDGFFDILDKAYENVYGTVPFTDGMKKLMVDNFNLIIDNRFTGVILDENEKVVLMCITFPNISKAMKVGGGHLTPRAIIEFLKAKRHPEVVDLGLIGVDPEWANRGISICMMSELAKIIEGEGAKYAETNLNLEDNYDIRNYWKHFNSVECKKRRAYVKTLVKE